MTRVLTRTLPPRQLKILHDLEYRDVIYNKDNHSIAALLSTGMVRIAGKSKSRVVVTITARGRDALERDARGVDPFLILTV